MIVEPLNERIMVGREASEEKSKGGIIIPDQAQKQSQRGFVLATWQPYLDKEDNLRTSKVVEGDVVLIPKYAGEEFELHDGSKVILLKESELLAVIRDYNLVSDEGERETA